MELTQTQTPGGGSSGACPPRASPYLTLHLGQPPRKAPQAPCPALSHPSWGCGRQHRRAQQGPSDVGRVSAPGRSPHYPRSEEEGRSGLHTGMVGALRL